MPNWVRNVMTLDGKYDDIMKALESVKRDDASLGTITFQKIVPRPESEEANWYNWDCKNWGTKWDAEQADEFPFTLKARGDGTGLAELTFDTAWTTPFKAIESFAEQHPELHIDIVYADELIPTNSGSYVFAKGELRVDKRGYADTDYQKLAFRVVWCEDPFNNCDRCSLYRTLFTNAETRPKEENDSKADDFIGQNKEGPGKKCSTNLN